MQHCAAESVVDERVWSESDHGIDSVSPKSEGLNKLDGTVSVQHCP